MGALQGRCGCGTVRNRDVRGETRVAYALRVPSTGLLVSRLARNHGLASFI